MSRPRLVYAPETAVDYDGHVFAAEKFRLAAESLPLERAAPEPPSRELLLLAHDEAWVDAVLEDRLTPAQRAAVELPVSPAVVLAHRLSVGGTLLAARDALARGVGLHAGGGAHHAFRGRGEGYCLLNDLAIAVLALRREGRIRRAAVVDLDAHQGNGTAAIFAGDADTFTFSMHQDDLYPSKKERSSLDVEISAGTGDAEYYDLLKRNLRAVLDFKPELVVYQAGVDVWEKDKLGGLKLTERGVLERDAAVRDACRLHGVPVAVTLGGGYGPTPADTARLHAATLRLFAGVSGGRAEA